MSFINDPNLAPPGSRINNYNMNQIPPPIDQGMQIKAVPHRIDEILPEEELPKSMGQSQLSPTVQQPNFVEPIPQQESSAIVCQQVETTRLPKLKLLRTKKELTELKSKLDQLPLNPNEIHTLKKLFEPKKKKKAIVKKPTVSLKKTIKETIKEVKKETGKPKKKAPKKILPKKVTSKKVVKPKKKPLKK